jgi:hypothetical protein
MDNKEIIELFFQNFNYLKLKGYSEVEIYENSDYQVGIILKNPRISKRICFAYYNSILTGKNLTPQEAIFFTIFKKDNKHIDLSRLLKDEFFFKNNCSYQYILLNNQSNLSLTLNNIKAILNEKYEKLISGDEWIDINYDLRDDY